MNQSNTILNYEQSVLFEIFELTILFSLIIFYIFNNNTVLTIAYSIPFIEHIKQIRYRYRQKGDSMIDKVTFFYFLIIMLYSITITDHLSILVSFVGMLIHIVTMNSKKSFARIVSYQDIKKYLFY